MQELLGIAFFEIELSSEDRQRTMLEKWRMIQQIVLLIFVLSPAFAEAQTIRVSGSVRDAQLDTPLVGSPVYLLGTLHVQITDANGQYAFKDVNAGQYLVKAAAKGYSPQQDSIVIAGDADLIVNFNLTPIPGEGSNATTAKQSTSPVGAEAENREKRVEELKTVCDCFNAGIKTLDDAISLRKAYKDFEAYRNDRSAVKKMDSLMDEWRQAQQHCLIKFGTMLFTDSACNRPDEVSEKRNELSNLGIKS